MKELSNWGRWGDKDELGAANLITPAKRKQALALAREGLTISLAHDIDSGKGRGRTDHIGAYSCHRQHRVWRSTGTNTPAPIMA